MPETNAVGASLYFSNFRNTIGLGDIFSVDVKLNSPDIAINAVEGIIFFSQDNLELINISKNGSILSLWSKEPKYKDSNGGEIIFSGGLPNPGFTGESAKIISLIFKAKNFGKATVEFKEASILANDGKGTNILEGQDSVTFEIIEAKEIPAVLEEYGGINPDNEIEQQETSANVVITIWPDEFLPLEESLYLEGIALPNKDLTVEIVVNNETVLSLETKSKEDGIWSLRDEVYLPSGPYQISARLKGASKEASAAVSMNVVTPAIKFGDYIMDYQKLFYFSLVLMVLILMCFVYYYSRVIKLKKKLLKEVIEAEQSLFGSFHTLRHELEKELKEIDEAQTHHFPGELDIERKKKIMRHLEGVKKYINREIKDIDELLR